MDRDEKIDGLVNSLLTSHEDHRESRDDNTRLHGDNARLLGDLEKLITAIREGNKNTYEVQLDLEAFTSEARLLINNRINEMSVERLADILTREKIDKVRALLYAREKGIAPPGFMGLYEPTGPQPLQTGPVPLVDEGRDPWYSRLGHEGLRANWKTLLSLAALVAAVAFLAIAATRALRALDHSHILPRQGQEHSELK